MDDKIDIYSPTELPCASVVHIACQNLYSSSVSHPEHLSGNSQILGSWLTVTT